MDCLHNCVGTFCKVLGKNYIYAPLSSNPVLVNTICDKSHSESSIVSFAKRKNVENLTVITDVDAFLRFYVKTNIVWMDDSPVLLDEMKDGKEIKFDAITVDNHGYQAVLLWIGNKPTVLPILKSGEFILIDIYYDMPVNNVKELDGNLIASVDVNENAQEMSCSCNSLFVNGNKVSSYEVIAEALESGLPATATVFSVLNDYYRNVYHCISISVGHAAIADNSHTYAKGNIYMIDASSELKEIINPAIIYYDIPFHIAYKEDCSELSFVIENHKISLKNYANCLQELQTISAGIGHIYYDQNKNEWQVLVINSEGERIINQNTVTSEDLSSNECEDKSSNALEPSDNTYEDISESSCSNMTGVGALLKDSKYLQKCSGRKESGSEETKALNPNKFSRFLKNFDLKNCPSLSNLTLKEILHLKELLNSSLPKELPYYLERVEGKLVYHDRLKLWFIICKEFEQCIIFSNSYLTVFYYKGDLTLSNKINIDDGTVLYVDAMLTANCLSYIPVLVYDDKTDNMNLVTDKYIYYYNIKGKLKGTRDKAINIDVVIEGKSLSLNDVKFKWGNFKYDFEPDTEVNIHLQKHIEEDSWEILFMDLSSLRQFSKFRKEEEAAFSRDKSPEMKKTLVNEVDHDSYSRMLAKKTISSQASSVVDSKGKQISSPYLLLYYKAAIVENSKGHVTVLIKLPDGRNIYETLSDNHMLYNKNKNWIPIKEHPKTSTLWCDAVVSEDRVSFASLWEVKRPEKHVNTTFVKYYRVPGLVKVFSDRIISIIIWVDCQYKEITVNREVQIFHISTGEIFRNLAVGDFVLLNMELHPLMMSGWSISLMLKCSNSRRKEILAKGIFVNILPYFQHMNFQECPSESCSSRDRPRSQMGSAPDVIRKQYTSASPALLENPFITSPSKVFNDKQKTGASESSRKDLKPVWSQKTNESSIIFEGDNCMLLSTDSKTVNTVLLKKNICSLEHSVTRSRADQYVYCLVAALKEPIEFGPFTLTDRAVVAWLGKMHRFKVQIEERRKSFEKAMSNAALENTEIENLKQSLLSDAALLSASEQLLYDENDTSYCVRTFEVSVQVVSVSGDGGIVLLNPDSNGSKSTLKYGYFNKNTVYIDNVPLSSVSAVEFLLKMRDCISEKKKFYGQVYECKPRIVQNIGFSYALILLWNETKPITDNVLILETSELVLKSETTPNMETVLEPPMFIFTAKPLADKTVGKCNYIEVVVNAYWKNCEESEKNKYEGNSDVHSSRRKVAEASGSYSAGSASSKLTDLEVSHKRSATCIPAQVSPSAAGPVTSMCFPPSSKKAFLTGTVKIIHSDYGEVEHPYDSTRYTFTRNRCFLFGICLQNINLVHILKPGCSVEFVPDANLTASRVWIGGEPTFNELEKAKLLKEWCIKQGVSTDTYSQLVDSSRN